MIAARKIALIALGVMILCAVIITQAFATGKIVVADDDWTLSDSGFASPNDPGVFAVNVANWFTGGLPGSFLAYSSNFGLAGSKLRTAMTTAGHSWTVTTTGALDLPRLGSYDGVFLSVAYSSNISAEILTQYVRAGGNVYVYAGSGAVDSPAPWNPFLANFGLKYASSYNPLVESSPINSTHPIFAGVDSLYRYNGNDVIDLEPNNPANQVLVVVKGHGIYAVYDGSLEPQPVISSVTVDPPMAASGDKVSVSVDTSGGSAVSSVTANGVSLINTNESTWTGSITASAERGVHNVVVAASDLAGKSASDSSANYLTAPVVGTSGKGISSVSGSACSRWLFRVWGKVRLSGSSTFFEVNDGSGNVVTVIAPGYTGINDGDMVSVRGILNTSSAPVLTSRAELVKKY